MIDNVISGFSNVCGSYAIGVVNLSLIHLIFPNLIFIKFRVLKNFWGFWKTSVGEVQG